MTKEDKIKINKVLNRGQFLVNFPVMIVMFSCMGITLYLSETGVISKPVMFIGLGLSFVLAWLVWSFAIVKWRIWAFQEIDEKFHKKLKSEAVKVKLIWPDGHIFEKTEIRSKEQHDKIKAINDRMEELNNS